MTALLLTESKTLYLHPPKTGGTWVGRALGRLHIDTRIPTIPDGVSRIHPPLSAFAGEKHHCLFATVRHPVSWLVSWWRYQCRNKWRQYERGKWHPMRSVAGIAGYDFALFAEQWLAEARGFITRMFEWYVGPANGCVEVLRQESLESDLRKTLAGLGYNASGDLPKPAKVSQCPPPPTVSESLRIEIEDPERPILERFYG